MLTRHGQPVARLTPIKPVKTREERRAFLEEISRRAADLRDASETVMSAATLTEALIVTGGRCFWEEMAELVADLSVRIEPMTEAFARRVAAAYAQWGRGVHPAALNFRDCFSSAVAKQYYCPLLYVGNDFAKTDITNALAAP